MNTTQVCVSEEEIARRAYEIWEARGCPPGDGTDNWQAAEAELLADRICRGESTHSRLRAWWRKLSGQHA
ncbi:MAG: DUF2934 domain-containing protein [Pirellulales bacterium]|nr:DUF2934 domain-containing protein [Pirellulales bacterium]